MSNHDSHVPRAMGTAYAPAAEGSAEGDYAFPPKERAVHFAGLGGGVLEFGTAYATAASGWYGSAEGDKAMRMNGLREDDAGVRLSAMQDEVALQGLREDDAAIRLRGAPGGQGAEGDAEGSAEGSRTQQMGVRFSGPLSGLREDDATVSMRGLREDDAGVRLNGARVGGLREDDAAIRLRGLREDDAAIRLKGLREDDAAILLKGLREDDAALKMLRGLREDDAAILLRGLREDDAGLKLGFREFWSGTAEADRVTQLGRRTMVVGNRRGPDMEELMDERLGDGTRSDFHPRFESEVVIRGLGRMPEYEMEGFLDFLTGGMSAEEYVAKLQIIARQWAALKPRIDRLNPQQNRAVRDAMIKMGQESRTSYEAFEQTVRVYLPEGSTNMSKRRGDVVNAQQAALPSIERLVAQLEVTAPAPSFPQEQRQVEDTLKRDLDQRIIAAGTPNVLMDTVLPIVGAAVGTGLLTWVVVSLARR